MSKAVWRIRRSWLGKAILMRFSPMDGEHASFRDFPFRELGDFALVPLKDWALTEARLAAADKATAARRARRQAQGDFTESRLSG